MSSSVGGRGVGGDRLGGGTDRGGGGDHIVCPQCGEKCKPLGNSKSGILYSNYILP